MKLKLDVSLPRLVKLRFCVQLGADVGARLDVRLRLRGNDPLRWRAALAPGKKSRLISDGNGNGNGNENANGNANARSEYVG